MSRLCIQDSWLSYNPVTGCSGNCIYCFQKPKKLTGMHPLIQVETMDAEYSKVMQYYKAYYHDRCSCNGMGTPVPIAVGTDADMFDDACISLLYKFLDLHVQAGSRIPIVIHTKKAVSPEFILRYKNVTFPIIVAISISLLPPHYEPGIQSIETRLQAAANLRKTIIGEKVCNIFLLHKWQPFILTPEFANKDTFISKVVAAFDCSIVIGLRITKDMYHQISNTNCHPLFPLVEQCLKVNPRFFDHDAKELLPLNLKDIFGFDDRDYPVFRNSSCAISYFLGKPDYTGTYWRNDICKDSHCPPICLERCNSSKKTWDDAQAFARNYSYRDHFDHIEVLEPMEYEKTIAQTHLLGKPVIVPNQTQKMEWFCGNYRYYNQKYYQKESSHLSDM